MQVGLGFRNRVSGVIVRISLVLRPVVSDAAHDFLRIVATRERAFGVRPIRFGLTPVPGWYAPGRFPRFVMVTTAVGRIFVHHEVAELVDLTSLLNRTNLERLVIFPVPETRYAKHAGYVGGRGIATELPGERA